MMKLGGMFSEQEAVNFLLDKVGDPYITQYVHHVSSAANSRLAQYVIVPGLHVRNFPADRQQVDDNRAHHIEEAFFKANTHTACNSRYNKNNRTTKTPDYRAKEILSQYSNKFKKLDRVFVEEVVGNGETSITEPFQMAQGRFFWGQVIPMCAGWFGEIGKDFAQVVKILAREAASGDHGMTILPLVNTDRKR